MKTRIISVILAISMFLSLAIPAFAEESDFPAEEITVVEPITEAEPVYEAVPEPATEAEPAPEPEPAFNSEPAAEPAPVYEEIPEVEIPTEEEYPAGEPYISEEILADDGNLFEEQTDPLSETVTEEELPTDNVIESSAEESVNEKLSPEPGEAVEFLEEEEHEDSLAAALDASAMVDIQTTFPDPNFCSYVSSYCDTDGDGFLNADEIAAVKNIYCSNSNITSLDGIKTFSKLQILYCGYNQLTSLDLNNCTSLKELECNSNELTRLNVKGCTSLKTLDCDVNQLTSLDLTGCTSLQTLSCLTNQLTKLIITDCSQVRFINCQSNNLTSLDVSKCSTLSSLCCNENQLKSLDVSACSILTSLSCVDNKLTSLDISKNAKMQTVSCSKNQITNLNANNCSLLTSLDCWNNQLNALILSGCSALKWLYCSDNKLKNLDISDCANLSGFICHNNQLTKLDISGCPNLLSSYNTGVVFVENNAIVYYNPDNDKLRIKFDHDVEIICNPTGEQTIDESGVLKEGSGWQLLWKCYGNIDEESTEDAYDLTLEITLEEKEGEVFSDINTIMINSGEGFPWLAIEGIDRNSFTHLIIRGTTSNQLFVVSETFKNYANLKDVAIDRVQGIALCAFEGCTNLERVDGFDEYLIDIGDSAFKDCTKLRSVAHSLSALPENLETIGDNAFEHTNLEEIYLMKEIAYIGSNAFLGCKDKLTIYCYANTEAQKYAEENGVKYEWIEEYTGFRMWHDSWSFENFKTPFNDNHTKYYMTVADRTRLLKVAGDYKRRWVINEKLKSSSEGSCRGMAAAVLVKMGLLSTSDFQSGAEELYDVRRSTSVDSLINYYYFAQFLDNNVSAVRDFRKLSDQQKLIVIEHLAEEAMDGGAPFVLEFGNWQESGCFKGHAVVGFGVESAPPVFHRIGYHKRILIYDVNDPQKISYLYYNTSDGRWSWKYRLPGTTYEDNKLIWVDYNYHDLIFATNTPGVLIPSEAKEELDYSIIYSFAGGGSNYALTIDGQTTSVTPNINGVEIIAIPISDGDSIEDGMIVTIPKNASEYVITPSSSASDFMISLQDSLIDVDCSNASSITFHPDGSFTAADVSGNYDMTLLFNEGAYNTPWYETNIQGNGNGSISMSQVAEGILIDGANDGTVTVTVTDTQDNASQISYNTDEATVLVTNMTIDGEEVPVVKADKDGDGTFEHLVATGKAAPTVKLDREYMLLHTEEEETLNVSVAPEEVLSYLKWTVENADEETVEEDPIITVDENGKVTALKAGTAFAVASVKIGDKVFSTRCRVDVVDDDETSETPIADAVEETKEVTVTGVTLPETKGTVELYKSDYTRITILANLRQNMPQYSGASVDSSMLLPAESWTNTGVAIGEAYFTEESARNLFDLRVVDDRTLEVRPKEDTMRAGLDTPKEIKGSYSSPISVWIEGKEFTTPAYTITVKKSLPKISASAVKLNSFFADEKDLVFKGENVLWIDTPQDAPGWLSVDTDAKTVTYTGQQKAKQSGKLNLVLGLDGWAIKQQVTVSVSAANTQPKITVKPTSMSVRPESNDSASAEATITPAIFADRSIEFVSITEGKTTIANGDRITCSVDGSTITVRADSYPADGKAHTYKVNVALQGSPEITAAVTVKTVARTAAVTMSVKASGTIDMSIPNSPIVLTPTLKNYNSAGATFSIAQILKEKKGEEPVDVTDAFNQTRNGSAIVLTANDASVIQSGYTYTAVVQADIGNGQALTANAKLNIKWPTKAPAITVTLKNSKNIDVLRPGSTAVIVTPTVKNVYGHVYTESDLIFYRGSGAKAVEISREEAPFTVITESGGYQLKLNGTISDPKTDTYSLGMRFTTEAGQTAATKTPVLIPIKMGTAKPVLSTKEVQLLKNDRYSYEEFRIETGDETLAGIREVRIVDKTNSFAIETVGSGKYAIHFAGNEVSAAAMKAKSMSVKLEVYLEGNNTAKANATLSLKVNIA